MTQLPTRPLSSVRSLFPIRARLPKILAIGIAAAAVFSHSAFATSAAWDGSAGTLWSDPVNWDVAGVDPGTVPGAGETATFSGAGNGNTTIDLGLGLPIGSILFDTASVAAYTIGSAVAGVQTLTMDGASPITVNATVVQNQLINANVILGTATGTTHQFTNSSTTNSLTIAGTIQGGTGGTAGAKILNVSTVGAANFTNAINAGGASSIALRLNSGSGTLTLSGSVTSNLADLRVANNNGLIVVDGQTVNVANGSNYGGSGSGALGRFELKSGAANFNGGINFVNSSSSGGMLKVSGGAFTASSASFNRTGGSDADTATTPAPNSSGLVVTGGTANITTVSLNGGTSSAAALVDGGSLTAGEVTVANGTTGRWYRFQVNSGTFTSTDTTNGIILARSTGSAQKASLLLTGGTTTVEKISFGLGTTNIGSTGTVTLNGANAALYLGSGGMVQGAAAGYTTNINLQQGTLAAKASWGSALSMNLTGAGVTIKAADETNVARDITLSGVLAGANGFSKTGAGTLALTNAANTYGGATNVNAGTLLVSGSIAGSATTVNDAGAFGAGAAASTIGTATTGAFSLVDTAEFLLDINIAAASSATSDLVNVGNLTLDLDNSAVLSLANLGSNLTLDPGVALSFLDYSGTWNGGTFAGLADDSTFALGANTFRISYNGVNDNDTAVVLVAVPEPASAVFLLGGAACLIGMRRPNRRRA